LGGAGWGVSLLWYIQIFIFLHIFAVEAEMEIANICEIGQEVDMSNNVEANLEIQDDKSVDEEQNDGVETESVSDDTELKSNIPELLTKDEQGNTPFAQLCL